MSEDTVLVAPVNRLRLKGEMGSSWLPCRLHLCVYILATLAAGIYAKNIGQLGAQEIEDALQVCCCSTGLGGVSYLPLLLTTRHKYSNVQLCRN